MSFLKDFLNFLFCHSSSLPGVLCDLPHLPAWGRFQDPQPWGHSKSRLPRTCCGPLRSLLPEDGPSALLVSPRHLDAGLGLRTVPPFSLVRWFPHRWTGVGLFGKHPAEVGTLLSMTRQGFPMSCHGGCGA